MYVICWEYHSVITNFTNPVLLYICDTHTKSKLLSGPTEYTMIVPLAFYKQGPQHVLSNYDLFPFVKNSKKKVKSHSTKIRPRNINGIVMMHDIFRN